MASSGRRPSALTYAAFTAALLGGGAALYFAFGRGSGDGPERERPASGSLMDRMREADPARAAALDRKLTRLREMMEAREREARSRAEAREAASPGGAKLSGEEEAALAEAVGRLYDPAAIREALSSADPKAGGAYARELEREFRGTLTPEGITLDGRKTALTPALDEAIREVDVLRSYATALMHAHAPRNPERQGQMIDRVNREFGPRLGALRERYPFLDAPLCEPR